MKLNVMEAPTAVVPEVKAKNVGGPPPDKHRPPPPVSFLMQALDTNHDGVLDAEEIANASASLLKLDKNGDGKLTADELRPTGPPPGHK
jgi:hypothetical protein